MTAEPILLWLRNPSSVIADEFHAPAFVTRLKGRDRACDIDALRQPLGEVGVAQRPGRREQQGLDLALGVGQLAHAALPLRVRR